jgi:hypothetical protein
MEEHAKEILALAWSLFNSELRYARHEMVAYLEKHFELKQKPNAMHNAAEGLNGKMPTYF